MAVSPRSLANLRPGIPWKAGQSGNPGGMPKMLKKLRRKLQTQIIKEDGDADILEQIARDPTVDVQWRLKAIEMRMAYAFGRPPKAPEELAAIEKQPQVHALQVNVGVEPAECLRHMLTGDLPADPAMLAPVIEAEAVPVEPEPPADKPAE